MEEFPHHCSRLSIKYKDRVFLIVGSIFLIYLFIIKDSFPRFAPFLSFIPPLNYLIISTFKKELTDKA
ncbi:hypothetical protein JCM21714_3579 [Gracilibacillus boraciitolerans JCM 21714]|uniref:Uncharacterized protein n=1 Tax=Gracilibacillus boraciitolerans JCM 21714 TaxID=1298598 RepID=W4VNN5_9BACI|nr:hypothetical protein JCM21714_3579 [Gracilibacillus boraciitolerans JCM 21714]